MSAQYVKAICYEFSLKNRYEELSKLSDWLNLLASQIKVSPRGMFRLELVLTEAVTNIIDNAYEDDREHEIELLLLRHELDVVEIQIRDDGLPFDPQQYAEWVAPHSLQEAKEGGLGIHLIRSYTDSLQYERRNNRNLLTMTFSDSEKQES